jgi:diguanylate cyclase (GGDEF)-like protein
MIAPPFTSATPQLSFHKRIPIQRFARVPSARLEQERFTACVSRAVSKASTEGITSHALLAIDLDGFTRVRASFGASVAALLLSAVATRVRECLGPDDEMANMGGDEFHVLIASDAGASGAWQVAELMMHVLSAPYALGDRQIALSTCIGIALVRPDHVSPSDVTRDAYAAMHRAKCTGSGRCALFDAGMHEATIAQLTLVAELREAIDRREFRMHYQPILGCRDGALVSLEALIRWEHPTRGCVPPSDFLDALDRAGLMTEVGRWIVGEVAQQSVQWRDEAGLDVPIAVNVSPRQLADPSFVREVLMIVSRAGASPSSMAFEMTEDIELGKGDAPVRALRELRTAGFRVRIDDFGTGYSSLSYLQRLPIDGLKIDRAFLRNIERDEKQREIVAAIIRLAHVLGLDVVAEGVERREQLETLGQMGCDNAQGHFLSPPLPAQQMTAWLTAAR